MNQTDRLSPAETLASQKLILALDVSSAGEAIELVNDLQGIVGIFKVGFQLFSATGPEFVRKLVGMGKGIFLDLKFHDIPNTVAAAGVEALRLGVSIFNVHAMGGSEMMKRTANLVNETADREGLNRPAIIAVTVLTSSGRETLVEAGVEDSVETQVLRLAKLADDSGMDGVVASPQEVRLIRSMVARRQFLIVTPGVRPAKSVADDQHRVLTPAEAIRAGADYLVIGRPITGASSPRKAAEQILQQMA